MGLCGRPDSARKCRRGYRKPVRRGRCRFFLSLQSATAFQDKMDEVVGFHIKSILIAGTALLDAAVVELQGQETDGSPVDQKVPVSEHNSTSFLLYCG